MGDVFGPGDLCSRAATLSVRNIPFLEVSLSRTKTGNPFENKNLILQLNSMYFRHL